DAKRGVGVGHTRRIHRRGDRQGHVAVLDTGPVLALPALFEVAVAVLVTTVPHGAGLLIVTSSLAPAARLFSLSERTPLLMLHGPTGWKPVVQFKPAFVGRLSLAITFETVPGPAFLTTIW